MLVGRPNGEPLCGKLRTLVEDQHRAPNLTFREYAIDEQYGGAIRDREPDALENMHLTLNHVNLFVGQVSVPGDIG